MSRLDRRLASWVLLTCLCGAAAQAAACGSSVDDAAGSSDDAGSSGSSGASSSGTSGDGTSSGSSGDVDATSITVEPASTTLDVSDATPKTVQLVAHAQPSGAVITPTWTLDNLVPGSIDAAGLYTTSNKSGGVVNVTATYKGLTATAQITINYSTNITTGNVPANAPSLFVPTGKTVKTNDPKVPTLFYPVNGTMFPQNIYRVLFQWKGLNAPLYQLEFSSPLLKASIYTDGRHVTCDKAIGGATPNATGACWESELASWQALAATNAGQAVTLKIRSVDSATAPTTIYESQAYTINFSKKDVPGAIYYWSTTVAGVRRGAMDDPGPTNFLTPAQAKNNCVACHTVSKNGALLAADIGGENLGVVRVTNDVPPPVNFGPIGTPPAKYSSSWATFDPAAKYVVQSRAGVMTLRDSATGATVGPNAGLVPLGTVKGIQPDWAWDGKHIVFAGDTNVKDRAGGPKVQWISTDITASGVTYGTPELIVGPKANTLYGYPMFNPTNDFISFVQGPKIEKDPLDQLYIVKATVGGTQTPINLTKANTLVNDGVAPASGVENNMATWAPTTGPDVQWIAFASLRDYGFVLRNGSKIGSGMQQIWIAAIDVSKLGSGADPSFPAFRVPFMELTENCHRPFWALDVLKGGGGGSDAGAPDAGPCITFGNDCSSGPCCGDVQCIDDGTGENYTCKLP